MPYSYLRTRKKLLFTFIILQIESLFGLQEIKIIDTKGQIVFQQNDISAMSKQINVSALPGGVYVVQLSNEQGVVLKKMIKTN